MPLLITLLLVLRQECDENRIARAIEELDHESIEVREAAEAELERGGEAAIAQLRKAVAIASPERRARIERLLLLAEWRPWMDELSSPSLRRRSRAIKRILAAGPRVLPVLQHGTSRRSAFESELVEPLAKILESEPVSGLRFGILIDRSRVTLGQAVPGTEVFINVSPEPILLETAIDSIISVPSNIWRGGFSSHSTRRTRLVRLNPGEIHLKRRDDFLVARGEKSGSTWGPTIDRCGRVEAFSKYSVEPNDEKRWAGTVRSNCVPITFIPPLQGGGEVGGRCLNACGKW